MTASALRPRGSTRRWRKLRDVFSEHLTKIGPLPCARCGEPVTSKDRWDLGHGVNRSDGGGDETVWPEHQACNRSAGATDGNQARATKETRAEGTTMTMTTEDIPRQMRGLQYREARLEDIEHGERIIVMRAAPYDVETRLAPELFESFEPGAFAKATKDPARVKLYHERHSNVGGQVVGQGTQVESRADGAWIRFKVSKIQAGDDLLTLADDGVLDEASVEFNPIPDAMQVERRADGLHVRHKRGHLKGVALVPHGAYGRDATVQLVRDDDEDAVERAREAALAHLRALDA